MFLPPVLQRWLFAIALLLPGAAMATGDSTVVFNELQYHPASGGSEWVEFHNLEGVNVDVSGWQIANGITYTFPDGTVVPGHGYLVVAAMPGSIPGALGPFSGALSNSGETLQLLNRSGRLMDEVTYGIDGDWPVGPNGSGVTLVKRNEETGDASAASWTSSGYFGGTPGAANFPAPGSPPVVTTLVSLDAVWKYRDNNVAPPAGWTSASFDDSTWASGGALLYAGSPDLSGSGDGLYGYWPIEETSGTTIANSVVGGTTAALSGAVSFVTDSQRGHVLSCPGTANAFAAAGTLPLMTLTNDFTWSFWANSTSSDVSIMVGNRHDASGNSSSPLEFIKFTPTSFEFYRNSGQEGIGYSAVPTGSWTHHALVKKGATMTYYRNGVASGPVRTLSGAQSSQQPFCFGGDRGGENWAGKLDDIALWTKALPSSSISGLASGSVTPLTAPTGSSSASLVTAVAQGPSTHYFRRVFNHSGAKDRATLTLQYLLDDGAVFYLNGTEVLRVNLPAGAVGHTTLASSNVTSTNLGTATIPASALVSGTNVLAVEVHQFSTSAPNNDLVFGASLGSSETPPPLHYPGSSLIFNEISAGGNGFQLELLNAGSAAVDLSGYQITSSTGASVTLPSQSVAAGGYAVLTAAQLGFTPVSGDLLYLFQPGGALFEDGQKVTGKLRGRGADGRWDFPTTASFGSANILNVNNTVAINEIMYDPLTGQTAQEKWIEFYNRGSSAVALDGWKVSDGISYTFPAGTTLAAGGYLILASDPTAFGQHHSGLTALGPFTGTLSGSSDHLLLQDAAGNTVDEVRYFGGGRWPMAANGRGSSLERRDPRADGRVPESWAASAESSRGSWQTFSWTGTGAVLNGDPTLFNEFDCGLLDNGTFLLDDVNVIDVSAGNQQLVQNGSFENGMAGWRFLGDHSHATVIADPTGSGHVLQVVATGGTEHMHNHLETTLKSGTTYPALNASHTYTISFRAKWVSGSNRLNARLYFNRLARTCILPVTSGGGTPGAANSTAVANLGPSISTALHSPAVPAANQAATVTATVADPDGVSAVRLWYSVNAGNFTSAAMTLGSNGQYTGTIPGQSSGAKVVFFVQANDALGAVANFPAAGAAARAMIVWDDGQGLLTHNGVQPTNVRILMPDADAAILHTVTNVMSEDLMPCTVIYNESDVYYGCGVKLKGSERGRDQDGRVSFTVSFPDEHPLLGVHTSIKMDRSGPGSEIMIKRGIVGAGGIPGSEDDLCHVIAPLPQHTGPAILVKQRFDSTYLNNQWANGADGDLFKYEYIYHPLTTTGDSNSPGTTGAAAENLKYPEPDDVIPVTMSNQGAGAEVYRWHWLILANNDVDNYSNLITWLTAFGRNADAQYFTDASNMMDVDEWLRAFAIETLFGVVDNYGGNGDQHNVIFYRRPTDGRWMLFPHDMDYTFQVGTGDSFVRNGDLSKLLGNSGNYRAYYGHLLDLCQRVFNTDYLTPWAQHYSKFLDQDLTGYMSYVTARRSAAISAINSAVPAASFAITTNNGQPLTVNSGTVTLQGTGWVDLKQILVSGTTTPLSVTWLNSTTWQVTLVVPSGTHNLILQEIGYDGSVLASSSISITNNATNSWAPLRLNEWLASNQSFPDPADGASDDWLELYNPTGASVSLSGWSLSNTGSSYVIPAGYQVPAGGYLTVWADNQTTENTGSGQLHVSFKLSASGESLTLRAPDNTLIDNITFGPQTTDLSEGRYPDGANSIRTLSYPTPGASNLCIIPSVSVTGNTVSLSFNTTAGRKYQAEVSSDLNGWVNLGTVQTATGNSMTLQEDPGTPSARFYRVHLVP